MSCVVAFDVTHIYAFVKEDNPRAYVKDRYDKHHQPKGDHDCKLGVKRSTNKEQADGSTKEEKEYLWGYGTAILRASATAMASPCVPKACACIPSLKDT